ncbi:long-chain fatty acid--CoA ligase [Actinokineospora auranticolor]|uniref:Acyl-CoA synthetase n=1 Tax=Actinokineospora auranticolor TaxID=155976 RepID=A0A2S6GGA9_9PSEU|nr:long-chain fatty acid--CoA ligase [Actinokineospora auranticolor]PPK64186.1 long-chain acyl-CoA synthetase [Actinokineospora auranticolor]
MREFSVPVSAPVTEVENLTDMVWANARLSPAAVAFRRRVDGVWTAVTTRDFAAHVRAVAKGLVASGLEPGDRVALLSRTRYEWTLLDFAIWAAGCVTVPVYETSSAEQVAWILSDSGARGVVVETAAHRAVVEGVVDRLGAVERIWQLDGSAVDELSALGASVDDDALAARHRAVRASDVASLVYTSGTTGRPKGVVLTHRNLLAEVRADHVAFPELMREGNAMLVFLPLAHVFARAIALCCVYTRTTLGHLPDVRTLTDDLAEFRPTFVVAVPRVFEKVYASARQRAHASGLGPVFDLAESVAVRSSESPGSLVLAAQRAVADLLVYGRLRAAFGGRCVAAISGSAPLGARLAHFFRGVGIPVYEGYGLTETAAAVCVNTAGHFRVGTVGRPVAGVAIRVLDDGEVALRGDMVSSGYWNNPSATEETFPDGWLRTGDLGELDDDGYLRITGRKKEIIVTAGGKNVAPAVLEDAVRRHPLVSQCMVVGDRQPFIAALVTLDADALPDWLARHGLASVDPDDPDLRADLQSAVDEANLQVSRAEAIREFVVLPRDFTEESGELTPSLKLRRDAILKSHATEVAAIYHP